QGGRRIHGAGSAPDARPAAAASNDTTARVGDVATGTPVTPPLEASASVERTVFSPDGRTLLTIGVDGAAWVWDVATGDAIAQVSRRADWVVHALAGESVTWDRPTDSRPVEQLVAIAQWLSGHRVDATGGLVPLTSD